MLRWRKGHSSAVDGNRNKAATFENHTNPIPSERARTAMLASLIEQPTRKVIFAPSREQCRIKANTLLACSSKQLPTVKVFRATSDETGLSGATNQDRKST